MNFKFLIEKLENSGEFKKFIEENKDAYLCSGFFIVDKEENPKNQYHLDFYIPSNKKTFSFELEEGIKLVELERFESSILEKISFEQEFDFDFLEEIILKEMINKNVNKKIQKLIFSLQSKDGKPFLIGTIFLSGLGLVSVNIDLNEKKITDFEKKSLFEMMKIVKK